MLINLGCEAKSWKNTNISELLRCYMRIEGYIMTVKNRSKLLKIGANC